MGALLLITLAGLHCQGGSDATRQAEAAATDAAGLAGRAMIPDFTLVEQSGRAFGSAQLRGKVWLATVIFTRSGTTTPQQMAQMATLQRLLADQPVRDGVRLVSITAEPEHDTPTVLRDFAAQAQADSARWKFLTGSRSAVVKLVAEGLGLAVREGASEIQGPITLSPRFVLVDRQLRVRAVYDVFTEDDLNAVLLGLRQVVLEAADVRDGTGRTHLVAPPENNDLSWLAQRQAAQLASTDAFDVFHGFAFTDRRTESGITFRHKIVDNAGKHLIANHYDHGNGVAVADVDGDGRLDLYFTTQVGANELWRNLGQGRFENVTEQAGVALSERISVTASFADVDNDGDADLYVTSVRGGNTLFANDGEGRFTDVTAASGLGYRGHSSGAVFFDYNRDGLLDVFLVNVGIYTSERLVPVTNGTSPEQEGGRFSFYEGNEGAFFAHLLPERRERSLLFRNLGEGRFADVTDEVGLVDENWSGDATPLDANDDGWPDLYVLNMQGDDHYYENVGGERFIDKSRALFPGTPYGAMGAKVFDYDNDGRMDLYVTDMHSDMSELIEPEREKRKARMQWPDSLLATDGRSLFGNAFFQKQGPETYVEVSDALGAENYWPWGLSVGDLNADGFQDVFVASSMNFPFRYGVNSVLLNNRGAGFLDSEFIVGVEPRAEGRRLTPWFTLDCDGGDRGHGYCQGRRGGVVVWASSGSRSSVVFDLEEDGDLDVVTNEFNGVPQVLVSDLSGRGAGVHHLKVRLVGTTSNRDGLGAEVTVESGGGRYVQVHDGVSGYLSHSVQPLYFGLGRSGVVDRVEVRWPSGTVQVIEGGIRVDTLLEVVEGAVE